MNLQVLNFQRLQYMRAVCQRLYCSPVLFRDSQVVLVVKNLPANAGDIRDAGSITGLGRSSVVGHGNPLQYSCLENPMDRGAWRATIHWITHKESDTTEATEHAYTIQLYTNTYKQTGPGLYLEDSPKLTSQLAILIARTSHKGRPLLYTPEDLKYGGPVNGVWWLNMGGSGGQMMCVEIQLPLTSCVTSDILLFSESQFPHLQNNNVLHSTS